MNKNIYLKLQGRIGNQLFQYALARKIQLEANSEKKIIVDDSEVIRCGWENSLQFYQLPNVEYIHNSIIEDEPLFSKIRFFRKVYGFLTKNKNYMDRFTVEKKINSFMNKNGLFLCENGYIKPCLKSAETIYLEGFFQSPNYFDDIREDLLCLFDEKQFLQINEYPGLDKIKSRNSVCISVKVEHNVGSSLYDVCSIDYWKKAIDYIMRHIENPLFFICSDDVDFVINNLIDVEKCDYIVQDKSYPVYVSLAVMSQCKHFITGNTTFGWWAQYLSKNEDKIVVAPSRWMAIEMPIDIYQDNWHLIEV